MENLKDKAFIENQDGTMSEINTNKVDPSIKGKMEEVVVVCTAPQPIRTFEAVKVDDTLKAHIMKNGSMTGNDKEVFLMTYDDGVTSQALVLKDDKVYLKGSGKEEGEEYMFESRMEILLHEGDYIARYDGLFNKVDNVIIYTDEINKLSELLKIK